MTRIAVVGCGKIGLSHLNAYKAIKGVDVVAVCDTNDEIAKRVASQHGAALYNDLEEMLRNEKMDAVDVCVPTSIHHEVILKALDERKSVFCEKPAIKSGTLVSEELIQLSSSYSQRKM